MAKAEWGAKRTCQNCGARFYDLRRQPITCPACGSIYAGEQPSRLRRQAAPAPRPPQPVAVASPPPAGEEEKAVEGVDDDDLEEIEEEEADEDLIEDASELDDEDDMAVAERLEGEG